MGWGCVVSRGRNQGGEYGAAYVKTVVGGALKNYREKRRRRKRRRSKCSDITNVTLSRHLAHEEVTSKQANPAVLFPLKHFLVLHLNKDTLLNNSGLYSSTQYCIDPSSSHPRHRKLKDIYSWTVQKMCRGFKMALHQKKSSGFQFEGKL